MADDLSLLFRLKGDATGLKQATAESRQAVNQLKQSFGPQLAQTVTATNKAFSDVGLNMADLAQRVPIAGNAFSQIIGLLRNVGVESKASDKAISGIAKRIGDIARESGKSVPQVGQFLTRFTQIGTVAERDSAAVEFFGASLATKLTPQLAGARVALAGVAAEGTAASGALATAGSAIAALAAPVAAAVITIGALVAGLVLVTRELFQASKAAADFQGKMQDLSRQTGLAVETLSALEIVAATTGGNLTTITQALVQFQRRLDESLDPLSRTAAEFRDLEIQTSDTESALRSAFTSLARMPEGFRQTNAAAELFGARGGKQVLAIIKETGGDVDGLIKRARDLGILIESDAARAADRFNEELTLLHFQFRELQAEIGNELIPVLTDLLRGFASLVRATRPFLEIIGKLTSATIRPFVDGLRLTSVIVRALTLDFQGATKALREYNEESAKRRDIPVQTTEGPRPVSLPPQLTPEQLSDEEVRLQGAVLAAAKRQVAVTSEALNRLFQEGRINRDQFVAGVIDSNQRVLDAERNLTRALIENEDEKVKALRKREDLNATEQQKLIQQSFDEAQKLRESLRDKEAQFDVESVRLRSSASKEQADAQRKQIADNTDQLLKEFDNQIASLEANIARGVVDESEGLTLIEQVERAKVEARIEGLEQQKRVGFLTLEEQKDLNRQIQAVQQEADHLDEEQQRRRLARSRLTAERIRDIKLAEIETLLQLGQLQAERTIASIEALADARVLSEEQAARRILAIRLGLIDSEIEATRARLEAASTIVDTNERVRAEADLNNRLRVLASERVSIETEGNRAIDDARATDLDNEQRYNDELERLRERTRDIEFDAAEEVIRLMRITFARRRDIIRAERDLDLAREADRNRRALESINRQQRAVDAEIKILEARLESLIIGTTEEIEQYERIIATLERLRLKRLELQGQADAEGVLSDAITRGINAGADIQLADPDTKLRDTFDDLGEGITDLTGKFADLIGAGKEFEGMSSQLASAIGGALAGAFDQFANAIGQTVHNWVLLGETGPAVMRKILAQALASLAAEAAVQAIKELALGFATLFFNPAESASHFAAAALWGSIAGVSAVAGRAVAGDLFKPQQSAGGAGRSGSGSSARDREPNPIDLSRQQQTINVNIIVHGEPGPGFNQEVVRAVVHDVSINGPSRDAIVKTAGG